MNAHIMGEAVYLYPSVSVTFTGEEELLDPAGKDLGPTSGHGAQPGFFQAGQGLLGRDPPPAVEVIYLRSGEGLDLDVGKCW